ncbi:MAG: CYTH domain-containing protein [Myxococcota bacterium]|nr:CYTH domain-containing protein [Myxococcota bacterium]
MPLEIERKFLVKGRPWEGGAEGVAMRQGYLARGEASVVRVRVGGGSAWLTIKGPTQGLSRLEFEYEIPVEEANSLLALCGDGIVEKSRYRIEERGAVFELDVFEGRNSGLVVAEIELRDEDEAFFRPDWLGEEVSHDSRYRNSELSTCPYSSWAS